MMFGKQLDLMYKYGPMEAKNGCVVPAPPYNIDNRAVQSRIKDMFWRTTEELSEALEVLYRVDWANWYKEWDTNADTRHFWEEIGDAAHFLIEASIYANLTPEWCTEAAGMRLISNEFMRGTAPESHQVVKEVCTNPMVAMGLCANCLKNKPWKESMMATDMNQFMTQFGVVWASFGNLFKSLGADAAWMYSLYYKKNQVNQFRQRTNY